MQTTKVMCHGTTVQFTCYSKESPDIFWKVCIERCLTKYNELGVIGNFFSAYMQGTLLFFLIKTDKEVQIHHWLNTDEHLVPKDIIKLADEIRVKPEINTGLFAAEVQPWKKVD